MRINCWLLFLLLSTYSLALKSEVMPASFDTNTASGVRQTVSGIISFTRWPHLTNLPRLCVFGSAVFAPALGSTPGEHPPALWQAIPVSNLEQALGSHCDVLYFGRESAQQQVELINGYHPHPLLTIAEQSPQCESGSAFCLRLANGRVSFSLNLDSLRRSGIRVHPDVLMLALPESGRHG